MQRPLAFTVLTWVGGWRWVGADRVGRGGSGGGEEERVVGVKNNYGGSAWSVRHGFGICEDR